MESYWDSRFRTEGRIWGILPSRTAEHALALFHEHNVTSVLVPGAGYGRNTKIFSEAGLRVTSVEISSIACTLAVEFDAGSTFHHASVLDLSFLTETYDAVYGFNILHLFKATERRNFLDQCRARLNRSGLMYFTVFSELEPSYGKGPETEENTFESKPGRPVHYFTADDLTSHFSGLRVLAAGLTEDKEDHGEEGPHTHTLRYICVQADG